MYYVCFVQNLKKDIPGIGFKEIGRELGERWNKLTAEEKAPYEARAVADRKRYQNEKTGYKNAQPAPMDLVDESDSNQGFRWCYCYPK